MPNKIEIVGEITEKAEDYESTAFSAFYFYDGDEHFVLKNLPDDCNLIGKRLYVQGTITQIAVDIKYDAIPVVWCYVAVLEKDLTNAFDEPIDMSHLYGLEGG